MGARHFLSYGTLLGCLLLCLSWLLAGCSFVGRITNLSGLSAFQISGSMMGVTVNSMSANSGSGCTPTVTLYGLNADGSKNPTVIASAALNSDGTFLFPNLENTSFDPNFSKTQYIIDADPCTGDTLSRLVTAKTEQNISYGSTLLSFVPDVKHVTKTSFGQIANTSVDSTENILNDAATGDIQTTYQAGLSDPTLTNNFQNTFGFNFSELQYSLPTVASVTHVSSVNELQAAAMSVTASHWDPNMTLGYIWKVDGVVKSTTKNFNWTPGKNEQGNYNIDLYVGIDTGSGLDISKSYAHYTYSFDVNDTYPATPPLLTLTSSTPTNSQIAALSLNTGIGFSNCQSFSKLVFTESGSSAALTLPSSADFTSGAAFTCTSAGTQSANFTMSGGDGNHTIALWAQDSSGNISQVSDFVNVTLDQTPPVIGALSVPVALQGGGTAPISFSVSDATSGVASAKLYYAADGSTFSLVADLTAAVSPYSWAVPLDNTSTAKLRLIAIDNVGNTATVDSNAFTVDSTAPSALTLAFTTPASFQTTSGGLALSKAAANGVTVTGCSGDAVKMLFKEVDTTEGTAATTPTAPLATDAGWVSCASSQTWSAIISDSRKTYFAWAKDAVGNISAVSSGLVFVLDQTSPTLALTSLNSGTAIAGGSSQAITWSATDAHITASTAVKLEYTIDGSTWVTITNGTANTGTYTWTVPSVDGSSNPIDVSTAQVRITAVDDASNPASSVTGIPFSIRSSGPVLSSTTINGGAQYAGTTLVNLNIALSDHGFATTGMKIVLNQAVNVAADCTLPATPVWLSWTNAATNIPYHLSTVGGLKKICAWAKNQAGFVSALSPFTCTIGTDCNTIELQTGSPPVISTLTAASAGGNSAPLGSNITISWAASAQGTLRLDNNPISFAYTTDNVNWFDVTTGKNLNTVTDTSESNPATAVMTWVGGLSGNPASGSGTANFPSPSNNFARLEAVARDTSGNYSAVAYSSVFNTTMANGGAWQIYAGSTSRGDGGSGTSASLYDNGGQQSIALNPTTGDIYARDTMSIPTSIRKLNVLTGKVSTFIKSGVNNLSKTGGALPSQILAPVSDNSHMTFGKNGIFYYSPGSNQGIYKIDLVNKTSVLYAGGGTLATSDSNALNIYVQGTSPIAVDEDNTLYFWTDCIPTTPNSSGNPDRLMKVTQNADGTSGPATAIAGNCSYGSLSPSGTLAMSATLGPQSSLGTLYVGLGSIVPLNHGQTIYAGIGGSASGAPIKITNNGTDTRIYTTTNLATGNPQDMAYNPIDGYIYETSYGSGLFKFLPITTGTTGGETVTNVVSASGTGGTCMNDGISASQTCLVSDVGPVFDSSGTVYFTDGISTNYQNGYRVRYLDSSGNISTIFGSLPFYGNGLQKELIRGRIGGIYYKSTSSSPANATAFPNGLYLSSPYMVFGYINPSTGIYDTVWGNQHNVGVSYVAGTTVNSSVAMGLSYQGGSGYPLNFDDNGHPWLRATQQVITLDDNLTIQPMDTSSATPWNRVATTDDPHTSSLYVYGGFQNFALAGNALFLIGAYKFPGLDADPTPQIRMLDFTNNIQPIILGSGYTYSQSMSTPASVAVGNGTTTPVANSPLSFGCTTTTPCEMQYFASSDTLYFSDYTTKIHYITNPKNPTASSLDTLGLTTALTITNFIVRPDGSQIFYITSASTSLYCYPLTAGGIKSWCPSSGAAPNLYSFAAQIGSLGTMPNMFTWMDSGNLLISTGTQILQYTLPTIP